MNSPPFQCFDAPDLDLDYGCDASGAGGPLLMFTPADEVRELPTRTPAEAIEAERDLRGVSAHQAILNLQDRGGLTADVADPALARAVQELNVVSAIEASTEAVWLQRLEQELAGIPPADKSAYVEAVAKCPELALNDRSRRLGMLRRMENITAATASGGDVDCPRLAARRLVRYWEERRNVYGDHLCYLPMTLHGAMRDEVASVMAHRVHRVLLEVDRGGRAVLLSDVSKAIRETLSIKSEMKHLWYIFECLCENRDALARGVVAISDYGGATIGHFDPGLLRQQHTIMAEVFPLHLRSIHLIYPNEVSQSIGMPLRNRVAGRHLRQRTVVHGGSEKEVLSSLDEYGIGRSMLRADAAAGRDGGEADAQAWVHRRLALEYTREPERPAREQQLDKSTSQPSARTSEVSTTPDSTTGVISGTTASPANRPSPSSPSTAEDDDNERSTALALALVDKMRGPRTDERMSETVKAKIRTPNLSSYDALKAGGFEFPEAEKGTNPKNIIDSDGVSLQQRQNQLSRRLRQTRNAFVDEKKRLERAAMADD